jgi:alpha-L-fucosidase
MKSKLSALILSVAVVPVWSAADTPAPAQPSSIQMAPAAAGLPALPWGRTTQKARSDGGATLYVHVWEWPADGKVLLPDMKQTARSGRMLAGGAAVTSTVTPEGLVVTLPGSAPDPDVSVAALELDRPVEVVGAAPLPTDTGASGTLADPSKSPPASK